MSASGSQPSLQGLVNQGPLFGQGQGQLGPGAPGWPQGPLYGQPKPQQPSPNWNLQSLQNEQVLRAQLELIKGGLDPSIISQVALDSWHCSGEAHGDAQLVGRTCGAQHVWA